MIDKNEMFKNISPENIKENQKDVVKLIKYLNKLHFSDKQFEKLEKLIKPIIDTIENYEDMIIKV